MRPRFLFFEGTHSVKEGTPTLFYERRPSAHKESAALTNYFIELEVQGVLGEIGEISKATFCSKIL